MMMNKIFGLCSLYLCIRIVSHFLKIVILQTIWKNTCYKNKGKLRGQLLTGGVACTSLDSANQSASLAILLIASGINPFPLKKKSLLIYMCVSERERARAHARERDHQWGRGREGDRESQAASTLPAQSQMRG